MTALLLGIGVLVFIALIVAGVNGTEDAIAQRDLNKKMGGAAKTTARCLETSLANDLGVAGISARMSGLTEFLHSLSSMEPGHRSGLPALALLVAGLLAIGGGVAVVVDRVEDRREFEACVEGATKVASGPSLTTTSVPGRLETAPTTDSPATTEPPTDGAAGEPIPEPAPDAPSPQTTVVDLQEPTSEQVMADLNSFLTTCLTSADGETRTLAPGPGDPEGGR